MTPCSRCGYEHTSVDCPQWAVRPPRWTCHPTTCELPSLEGERAGLRQRARDILAEWDSGYCSCQVSTRIRALLEDVGR